MRFTIAATVLSLAAALGGNARALRAQIVETPVAFDSAHRVVAITPRIAERLQLAAPVWPVQSKDYREARLYAVQPAGGFVLIVESKAGSLERFPLSDAARAELGRAIDAAAVATGRPSAPLASDVVSEPAGNAFARHQTFLTAIAYAPVVATLTDDPNAAGALYFGTTGVAFFVSYAASQATPFTRAQNDLAGSLGLSAGTGAWLAGYAATGNSNRGVRAFAVGSALAGTIAGVTLGEGLTDAEAHAAAFGVENGAAAGLLAMSVAGGDSRSMSAAAVVAGAIGYPIGVVYPRRASYNVTAGDVQATSTASLIGVLAGAAALGNGASSRETVVLLSAGYLAGGIAGDLLISRPYDLTPSQAAIANVGALAGAIAGAAVPIVFRSSSAAVDFGVPALGAAVGMSLILEGMPQAEALGARVGLRRARATGSSGLHLSLNPLALAAAAGGIAGHHVLAQLTF